MFSKFLFPLSFVLAKIWEFFASLKNLLYDKKILKINEFPDSFLIGVGNVEFCGTGKTTLAIALANYFSAKGFSVGVFTGNYKGKAKKGIFVSQSELLNDEANLVLAKTSAKIGVNEMPKTQVVILDDSFQKRHIKKNLEFCLVSDTKQKFCLPLGTLRENWKGLERADFVILTKFADENFCEKAIFLDYSRIDFEDFWDSKLVSLSSTGNFLWFKECLERNKIRTVKDFVFGDHKKFSKKELQTIFGNYKNHSFVTTEKDFLKIQVLGFDTKKIVVVKVNLDLGKINFILERIKISQS
ncbi:tetraacyldisaccharide 4'-kinase [bacterium]|nr:tetraacyldisaccharide 4'-kinase [bacterium]